MATVEERVARIEAQVVALKEASEKSDESLKEEVRSLEVDVAKLKAWRNWVAGGATAIGFAIGSFAKKASTLFFGS